MPDWIVSEELAAGAAEQGPIRLTPDLVRCGIVLALIGGFEKNKRPNWLASIFRQHQTKQRLFVPVNSVQIQPFLLTKCSHRGTLGRVMSCHQVGGILLADCRRQFVDRPLIGCFRSVVTAEHPDNVGQVFESLPNESAVSAEFLPAAGLDLAEESLIAAAVA